MIELENVTTFNHSLILSFTNSYAPTTTLAKRITESFKVYRFSTSSITFPFNSSVGAGILVIASWKSVLNSLLMLSTSLSPFCDKVFFN